MGLIKKKEIKTEEVGEDVSIKEEETKEQPPIPVLPYMTSGDIILMHRLDRIVEILEKIQEDG